VVHRLLHADTFIDGVGELVTILLRHTECFVISCRGNGLHGFVVSRFAASGQHDVSAFLGEDFGAGAADPLAFAGNNRGLSFKTSLQVQYLRS
jgi:hypothetical protein